MDTPDQPDRDKPPWELPGAVRRDCEPHRGELLAKLGAASLYCGSLSLIVCAPAFVGMPLGLAVWFMAHRDLGRMKRGVVDPAGQELTATGKSEALAGVGLSAITFALMGLVFYALLFP